MDGDVPLVALVGLPDHHHQAGSRAQRPHNIGERGDGIVEDHCAQPADRTVEALGRKAMVLRVAAFEGDVAEPLGPGELPAGGVETASGTVWA